MNISLDKINLKNLLKKEGYTTKYMVFEEEYHGGFYMTIPCEGYHVEIGKKNPSKISSLNVFNEVANPILEIVGITFKIGDLPDLSKMNIIECDKPYYSFEFGSLKISVFLENDKISCVNIEDNNLISENASNLYPKNSNLSIDEVYGYWEGKFLGDEKISYPQIEILKVDLEEIIVSSSYSGHDKPISYGVASKSKGVIKLNCSRINPLTNIKRAFKIQIRINNENDITYDKLKMTRITEDQYKNLAEKILKHRGGHAK